MNQQEFYDLVKQAIDKLEVQGVPAKEDNSPRCWYHIIKDGVELRCIVGHMMPLVVATVADGSIHQIEGDAYTHGWVGQFTLEQLDLLSDLQDIHDFEAEKGFALAIEKMRELLANE